MDGATTNREGTEPDQRAAPLHRWAYTTFVVLFLMNLLDYLDRNVLYAVLPQVKADLGISNEQAGLLATFFLVVYSIFGLFTGYAGDRMRRTYLLALGVGVWSLATVGSGLARSYGQLALARAILGIGEATYGVIAPTILLDLFPRRLRARVLSGFYLAMPIGSALGIVLGGAIAARADQWFAGTSLEPYAGWRMAFFLVGLPGLIAALFAPLLPEPTRGASEEVGDSHGGARELSRASWDDYKELMVNSSYTYAVFGMTAYTFAIGGLLVWVPTFLVETRGIEQARATSILGVVTLFAALLGMTAGGWLADRLGRIRPQALFLVPGLALLGAVPFILLGLFAERELWIFVGIFCAEALMFVNTGPCNAVIGNVVTPNMRAAAYAIAILILHFLGDIWSPWLIGKTADYFGQPDTMATGLGQLLASLGALPTTPPGRDQPQNLLAGLLIVVPAVALAGAVLLAGARHLPREMALMLARFKAAQRAMPAGAAGDRP